MASTYSALRGFETSSSEHPADNGGQRAPEGEKRHATGISGLLLVGVRCAQRELTENEEEQPTRPFALRHAPNAPILITDPGGPAGRLARRCFVRRQGERRPG